MTRTAKKPAGYSVRLSTINNAWARFDGSPLPAGTPYADLWKQLRAELGADIMKAYRDGWEAAWNREPAPLYAYAEASAVDESFADGYDDCQRYHRL